MRDKLYLKIRYSIATIVAFPILIIYSLFFYLFCSLLLTLPSLIALTLFDSKKQLKKDLKSILNETKIFYKLFKPNFNI